MGAGKTRIAVCFGVFLCAAGLAYGQDAGGEASNDEAEGAFDGGEAIMLPEAEVEAERDTPEHITQEEMLRDGAADLWEAVRYVPGVILSGGGRRNDSNFSVRGFGADSVPVFVDGIAMGNPYRGEGDAARFLTADLESIDIQKGYSSMLLGANTMGGAVLMRTAKPKSPLELSVRTSLDLDSLFRFGGATHVFNLGGRDDLFYGRAVFQYRDIDHYRLPESFVADPEGVNPQKPGDRLWSDSTDRKLTLMAGVTPEIGGIGELDVWLSYVYQDANKTFSPPEVRGEYMIWEWPLWERQSLSLNGSYAFGGVTIDGLFYFDKYDNRLDEYYSWDTYILEVHNGHSDYDEYSTGGRITGRWDINPEHNIQAALTYKKENHIGLWRESEQMRINEDTWSFGTEYAFVPDIFKSRLTVKAGAGFDALVPVQYWGKENELMKKLGAAYYANHFIIRTKPMFLLTWQAGLFYRIRPEHEVHLTYARKNHFPTMSQRYSTRFGRSLPNPSLGPEIASHFELGYRGTFFEKLTINSAVYYSLITGKIVSVGWPSPNRPMNSLDYAKNLDRSAFYGFEFSPELYLNRHVSGGLSLSLNRYYIYHSENSVKAISYYPPVTVNAYLVARFFDRISVIPRVEYLHARYANTEATAKLPSYFLAHLKVTADIGRYLSVSAGVENMFDTLYEIKRYFPMAGRGFTLSVEAKY
jgi:iron complex outermembrane receptor protein